MNKVAIVAVKYLEPEWAETKKCIEACNVPTVYIERDPPGVGGLAKALNAGFEIALNHYRPQYVWFVTNVTFDQTVLPELVRLMNIFPDLAAVHPHFKSDHGFLRRGNNQYLDTHSVPFVEFTAPLVRADVFDRFRLDDKMEYVGHDMAWGYDVRQAGYSVAVAYNCTIGHAYIRHAKPHPVTRKRRKLRDLAVKPTIARLIERYGKDYKTKLHYSLQL